MKTEQKPEQSVEDYLNEIATELAAARDAAQAGIKTINKLRQHITHQEIQRLQAAFLSQKGQP